MTQQLPHKEIIRLAEEVGLLVKNKDIPYSLPSHQRLISRLEKFAGKCYDEGYDKGMEDGIVRERG